MNIKSRIEIARTIRETNKAIRKMEKSSTYKLIQQHKSHNYLKNSKSGIIFPEKKDVLTRIKKGWDNFKNAIIELAKDD